jgi:hypothetical protein
LSNLDQPVSSITLFNSFIFSSLFSHASKNLPSNHSVSSNLHSCILLTSAQKVCSPSLISQRGSAIASFAFVQIPLLSLNCFNIVLSSSCSASSQIIHKDFNLSTQLAFTGFQKYQLLTFDLSYNQNSKFCPAIIF